MSTDVFKIFCCLFVKNIKNKVSLASIKSLTNCENPSSNPLQGSLFGLSESRL
jgi:hypothetical protein